MMWVVKNKWPLIALQFTCVLAVAQWVYFHRWYMPVVTFVGFGLGMALDRWQGRRSRATHEHWLGSLQHERTCRCRDCQSRQIIADDVEDNARRPN